MIMKTEPKVVAAGHICLDIAPVFPEGCRGEMDEIFVPGRLVNVEQARLTLGGSVSNTGLAMAFFGLDVRPLGKVGEDEFGAIAERMFKAHGVDRGLIHSPESATSYSIVLSLPGKDRLFLHHPGANDTFSRADLDLPTFKDAALFHFGYPPLMRRLYQKGGQELFEIFRDVAEIGLVTSLDLAAVDAASEAGRVDWRTILARVLPWVDIFAPSVEELLFMLDRERFNHLTREARGRELTVLIDIEKDARPLAEEALHMGAGVVLIKCGEPGLYYQTATEERINSIAKKLGLPLTGWADRAGFEPSYVPERLVSATGAGDVTIAAFLTALLKGFSLERCLQFATAAGACCVTEHDSLSGLMSFDEMQEKIDRGWKKREG